MPGTPVVGRSPTDLTRRTMPEHPAFDDQVDRDPSISGDGRYIVFSSNRSGGAFHIWRMDASGANQVRLTYGSDEQFPHCSPDGDWVVYQGLVDGVAAVWKVPIDGGECVRLAGSNSMWPSVSSDGRWVACSSR